VAHVNRITGWQNFGLPRIKAGFAGAGKWLRGAGSGPRPSYFGSRAWNILRGSCL